MNQTIVSLCLDKLLYKHSSKRIKKWNKFFHKLNLAYGQVKNKNLEKKLHERTCSLCIS